jgi:hypothetical protein
MRKQRTLTIYRNETKDILRRFRDYASKEITRVGAHHDPIWAEVADALDETAPNTSTER